MRQLGLKLCAVLLCSCVRCNKQRISYNQSRVSGHFVGTTCSYRAGYAAICRCESYSRNRDSHHAKGKLVHFSAIGDMDVASKEAHAKDAIFRIASMTKPIASVALMILWEKVTFSSEIHYPDSYPLSAKQKCRSRKN